MAELQDVRYGWDFMAKLLGADLAGQSAFADFTAATAQNQRIAAQNLRIQEINAANYSFMPHSQKALCYVSVNSSSV